MSQLNFGRDSQGYNAFSPGLANYRYSATLATGIETSITVPSDHQVFIASFSYEPGTTVWVDLTGIPADIPASNQLTLDTAELLPGSRTVLAGSTISMITDTMTADVGISLYAISYP